MTWRRAAYDEDLENEFGFWGTEDGFGITRRWFNSVRQIRSE